ncbi:hypothetical protein B9Z65_8125 [Elsinoe australis]|uniref:PH domain-containing protein n=1 Tax=Elsinoe australis TaxID=40998 RepID=A0A2P7YW46_9PEZI|nr:hypothetical protein B9Z65_8125 [Elsinoe australis]
MYIDDSSSTRHVASPLDIKTEVIVHDILNKPLPPVRHVNATPDHDPIITATPGFDRPSRPGRQLHEERSKMSLFHLFSKPKVERSRGYAEAGLETPPPLEKTESRSSRRESRGDLKGARLEKPIPGMPRDASRPRAPLTSRPTDPDRKPRPTPDAFDLLHPPQFKRIFSIAVKIAPAHTCLINGAKGTPGWKVGSNTALGGDFDPYDRPSSRRSSRMPPQQTPQLQRKIFSLTRNGYLLQYTDRGPSDRLPERLQRLTKDTCAIASDLVPGKPYTVQVAESASVQEITRPDSPSFLSRLGMKHGAPKKQIPSTLIVLDTAKELEEWLSAIRKEIHRQSRTSPTSSPPRSAIPPAERSHSATPTPRFDTQKEYGFGTAAPDRTDTPRESFNEPTRDPAVQEVGLSPLSHAEDAYNSRDSEVPTATQMYHRQVMLARQGSDTVSTVSSNGTKRRSLHSVAGVDTTSDAVTIATSATTSPIRTEPKMSMDKSRPYTPTSVVKHPTGLRQQSNVTSDEQPPQPLRKDSLMKSPEIPAGFVDEREAAHLARMRKRASHQGPVPVASPERPQLRSVSSLGRLRMGQPPVDSGEPMPAMPSLEVDSSPPKILSTGRVATRKKDNDEYHAFQLSMSAVPNQPRALPPSKKGRRHSAMPSQSSQSSTTSSSHNNYMQRHEQMQKKFGMDVPKPTPQTAPAKQLPPRLPFKLRGATDISQIKPSLYGPGFSGGHGTPVRLDSPKPESPSTDTALNPQRLRRPTSMQVRPNPAPFLTNVRSASNNTPPTTSTDPRNPALPTDVRKPMLRPSRSDHNLPSAAQRQRGLRQPPSHIVESLSDDEDMFILQGVAEPLRKPSTDGPLPPPDLGMPLVALGPPPPPPETPLPRLPPPPSLSGSRPGTPGQT